MTHLDEGQLLALRDDPSAAPEGDVRHLRSCASCGEALHAARARSAAVGRALATLDAGAGDLERAREAVRRRIADHAARHAGGVSPLPARAPRRAFWTLSRAAGILLVTAAGLSALPGSPVRRWLGARARPAAEEGAPAPAVPAPAAAAEGAPAEAAGVRLPVSGGPVSVVLRGAVPGTEIRVTWIPGSEAALLAPAGTRFTSGEGLIRATLAPGPVRVELRQGTSPASLEVDGIVFLRVTSAGLEVPGPVVERTAAGITFVVPER